MFLEHILPLWLLINRFFKLQIEDVKSCSKAICFLRPCWNTSIYWSDKETWGQSTRICREVVIIRSYKYLHLTVADKCIVLKMVNDTCTIIHTCTCIIMTSFKLGMEGGGMHVSVYDGRGPLWWYVFYAPLRRRRGILLCTCRSIGVSVSRNLVLLITQQCFNP